MWPSRDLSPRRQSAVRKQVRRHLIGDNSELARAGAAASKGAVWLLVEAIVLYDAISVPADVLERNDACRSIAALFEGVITGLRNYQLPDFHHHLIDRSTVDELRPHIGDAFGAYENDPSAYVIERTGMPSSRSFLPGYMGRDEPTISFAERQAYYTWYCVRLAAASGLNYAPNPTREALLRKPKLFEVRGPPAIERDLLKYFQGVRAKYAESIAEVFPSIDDRLELPLVYNFVKSRTTRPGDIVARTMELRASKEAVSFRKHCARLVSALQAGNRSDLETTLADTKTLGDTWAKTMSKGKQRKTIKQGISYVLSLAVDVSIPWPIDDPTTKPHFVFVHELLKARRARVEA